MSRFEIVDVGDETRFGLVPPCADPAFDHRTCDYWEDADHGSKASRPGWLRSGSGAAGSDGGRSCGVPANPFVPTHATDLNPFVPARTSVANPFATAISGPARNPFLDDLDDSPEENPLAPRRPTRPTIAADAPRKLQLLGRGLGVFGTYAKLLLVDDEPAGYCQFGPLSAYPRALRLRDLYPQLPDAPLPAVITCIATTAAARRSGHALRLVAEVCGDLAGRGFAAVEAYPETRAKEDATPAARPEFWLRAGFQLAVDDDRYPVVRREL
jgi:ribosomal protein S18 acetylase RimI-like enzyme